MSFLTVCFTQEVIRTTKKSSFKWRSDGSDAFRTLYLTSETQSGQKVSYSALCMLNFMLKLEMKREFRENYILDFYIWWIILKGAEVNMNPFRVSSILWKTTNFLPPLLFYSSIFIKMTGWRKVVTCVRIISGCIATN